MFLKRKNDSDVDLIVKKQHKTILIISVVLILMLSMLLYFNVFGLFRVGGYYLAEDGQHFKVGTTIPTFHFQNLQSGLTYRCQIWRPFDYPSPFFTEFTFSGPTHNHPINLYVDEDDYWRIDIDEWDSDFQEWFPLVNNGGFMADPMCADIDITPFTVTPYSVEVDDVVEVQWTVRNTGDFNGMFDWHVCIDKNYNGICSSDYIESGEVSIDMNGAWGHTTSFVVDEDMANNANVINVLLWVGFQGDDNQYPSNWYRLCSNNDNEERNEGIIFVPPDPPLPPVIDIALTVTTIPSNCDVFIAGVGTLNSGEFGVVVFEDVPYGYHNIVVSKSGYQTVTKTVFVDSDAIINIDLTQNILLLLLILIIIVIAVAAIIYFYKKGIIRI